MNPRMRALGETAKDLASANKVEDKGLKAVSKRVKCPECGNEHEQVVLGSGTRQCPSCRKWFVRDYARQFYLKTSSAELVRKAVRQ